MGLCHIHIQVSWYGGFISVSQLHGWIFHDSLYSITVDTCAHSSCQKFLAGCFGILRQKVEVTVVTWRFKWAPHIALVWRKKWAAGEVWENYYVFPATVIFMVVYSIWREIRIYTGITELQVWMYVFTPSTI